MSLFDRLGGAPNAGRGVPQNAQEVLSQAIETAKANYMAMIQQKGWTIPNGMTDPQQMVQHLVQSGQVPPARYQQAQQAAQMMQRMR